MHELTLTTSPTTFKTIKFQTHQKVRTRKGVQSTLEHFPIMPPLYSPANPCSLLSPNAPQMHPLKNLLMAAFFSKLLEWSIHKLFSKPLYKLTRRLRNYGCALFFVKTSNPPLKSPLQHPQVSRTSHTGFYPSLSKTHVENFALNPNTKTIVCDINGALLKSSVSSSSSCFFPFFMLVAFEGGSIIRAFLLLLFYPFCLLPVNRGVKIKLMVFITFCGMRVKQMESVGRTVLPKFFLEDLNPLVYQMWAASRGKVVITSVPRVMVEFFAKEYLQADHVLGTELHTVGRGDGSCFFSGFIASSGFVEKQRAVKGLFGQTQPDVGIGVFSSCEDDHHFISLCKEGYIVSQGAGHSEKLQRSKYPKPLIFHDGRLAFLPTPTAALCMFLYLPLAIPLAVLRLLIGTLLPYRPSLVLGSFAGIRLLFSPNSRHPPPPHSHHVLYVSTHRTLLDPVFLSVALQKPLTAVTYSLSRFSELIAPIPTVRLARSRADDAGTMQRLLSTGDLVVCPEGTTCREPYLLRFSSLFAELTDEIVPVAMEADVSMFYGTTASGSKWLDPVFFFMNPRPGYAIRVLEKVPEEMTCGGGGRRSWEVANYIQRELGEALGFECTELTRKDKYMMLAGNDGLVAARPPLK